MKIAGQLFVGLLTALGSSVLVLMAMVLALTEGGIQQSVLTSTPSPTMPVLVLTPAGNVTLQPSPTAAATATQPQRSGPCSPPQDWQPYEIQTGDTFASIAAQAGISTETLLEKNCMAIPALLPGTIVYVPYIVPVITSAPVQATVEPCGPPTGWVRYFVQPGDTLFGLSLQLNTSVAQLRIASCLPDTNIQIGAQIYVPFSPPQRTVQPTATAAVQTYTSTPVTVLPTDLPTKPGPSATPTPTQVLTDPTPTFTNTPGDLPTAEPTIEPPAATATVEATPENPPLAPTATLTPIK